MKENTMAMNFEPHECVIFVHSTKVGTHENKAIHSMFPFLFTIPYQEISSHVKHPYISKGFFTLKHVFSLKYL